MATIGLILSVPDDFKPDPGTGELHAAEGFAMRADGSCYFDPDGAVPGQAAWIRQDSDGNMFLEQDEPAVTFSVKEGARPPVSLPEPIARGCRRCGAPGPKRKMCAACREQADIRTVARLRRRDHPIAEIAETTRLPEPHVRYLLGKSRRMILVERQVRSR